jgi:hypothetical protein
MTPMDRFMGKFTGKWTSGQSITPSSLNLAPCLERGAFDLYIGRSVAKDALLSTRIDFSLDQPGGAMLSG